MQAIIERLEQISRGIEFLMGLRGLAKAVQHLTSGVMHAGAVWRQCFGMIQHLQRLLVSSRLAVKLGEAEIRIDQRVIVLDRLTIVALGLVWLIESGIQNSQIFVAVGEVWFDSNILLQFRLSLRDRRVVQGKCGPGSNAPEEDPAALAAAARNSSSALLVSSSANHALPTYKWNSGVFWPIASIWSKARFCSAEFEDLLAAILRRRGNSDWPTLCPKWREGFGGLSYLFVKK